MYTQGSNVYVHRLDLYVVSEVKFSSESHLVFFCHGKSRGTAVPPLIKEDVELYVGVWNRSNRILNLIGILTFLLKYILGHC